MFLALFLLFLVLPILELWVIVTAAQQIGILETLVALIIISVVGAWLCKWAGLGVFRRIQKTLARGQMPTAELVDGFLVLLAGALMLTPGFITDVIAILLLLPPSRAVARRILLRRYQERLERYGVHEGANLRDTYSAHRSRRQARDGDVIDVDLHSERDPGAPGADPFPELGSVRE